ncbi:hypothetical protein [Enterovirga aerilata]|uniref:Uncharacterized protein n=1 Tax=Enterovirga aerilata TaxID=2730920 RepID=A0A849I0K4_9HYPH|nr:hypothetical protein [Enterovirga sp. DB1703]NNM73286.1 hypothetical protein [Enterovirga sp. DB1703]
MKYVLLIAAVFAGDHTASEPSLELILTAFDNRTSCEETKAKSTGIGKGEIRGRQVLRIVGVCQELSEKGVAQLKESLNR